MYILSEQRGKKGKRTSTTLICQKCQTKENINTDKITTKSSTKVQTNP